jgi:hypothetical protein
MKKILAIALVTAACGHAKTNTPAAATHTDGANAGTAGQPHAEPVAVPGGEGGAGFDDLRWAPGLGRIVVPGARTGSLDLIDPATRDVTAIGGFSTDDKFAGGHGEGTTSADEGKGLLFAIDRSAREVMVVDPAAKKIISRASLGGGPDYVRFVDRSDGHGELWVTEPNAHGIEIFTLSAERTAAPVHAAFIDVPGGPESLEIDVARGRAYTHLWTDSTVVLDLADRKIVATWKNGCEGSRGIALDRDRQVLFVGCDEGGATALDVAHDGKLVGKAKAGAGVDVIAYDAKLHHLYVPAEDAGTLTIMGVADSGDDRLKVLGTVAVAKGSHCAAADQQGGAWVCDPSAGRMLYVKDSF